MHRRRVPKASNPPTCVSAEFLERDKLGPYNEAAQTTRSASWYPSHCRWCYRQWRSRAGGRYKGAVLLEKYDSMSALLSFWNSSGYQEAKKLREGVKTNFIIAMEATD